MQRQALPLIQLEQPIVTTLNAFRVLSDLKDIPTTSNSGVILYASQQKISFCFNLDSKAFVPRDERQGIAILVYIQSPLSNGWTLLSRGTKGSICRQALDFPMKKFQNNAFFPYYTSLNLEKQKSIQQTISFFKDRKKF